MQYSHEKPYYCKNKGTVAAGGGSTVAVSFQFSPPPAQGSWGSAGRRRLLLPSVRSSGDRRGGVLLAGTPGRQAAGAGEDRSVGESRAELEGSETTSGWRKSSGGGRGSQGYKNLPLSASESASRPQWPRRSSAEVVWALQRSSMAREGGSCFRAVVRCFPDDWTEASRLGEGFGTLWVQTRDRRWGRLFAARRTGWVAPGGSWRFGEEVWMLGGAFWSGWREFGGGVDFGPKWSKVFEVGRFVCRASWRWRLGGLGRWRLGECLGKVWGELGVCGAGNFRMGLCWVRCEFQRDFWVKCGLFRCGKEGETCRRCG